MARHVYQNIAKDGNGAIVTGATVSIFLAGTTTVASVYTVASGGSAVNTVTTNAIDGSFIFYVDDVDYTSHQLFDIVTSKTNYQSYTAYNVAIFQHTPWVDVLSEGATGDGVTDDTIAIQAAADKAEATTKRLYFPTPSVAYKITDRILIDTAAVLVEGSGFNCIVRQDTWGKPAFEVRANDVTIDSFQLLNTQTKTVISTTPFVDGISARAQSSGVYVANSDRYNVRNIYVDGFVVGIFLRGQTADSTLSEDGIVEIIRGQNLDSTIVFGQQRGITIDDIKSQDNALSQIGDPIHAAIYAFGAPIGSEVHSEDGIITNIYGRDTTDTGHMVQLKYVKGFTGGNWTARNTKGLYLSVNALDCNFTNLNGFEMGDVVSDSVAIIHISGNSDRRNRLSKIHLESSIDSNVYTSILNATGTNDDNIIEDVTIIDTTSGGAAPIGSLRGTRNTFKNYNIICISSARRGIDISKATGDTSTGCRVEDINSENTKGTFIDILAGAVDTVVDINSSKIDLVSGGPVFDLGTTSKVNNRTIDIRTLNNSDATPAVIYGDNYETGTVADTITAWDFGFKGQTIIVKSKAVITYDLTTANDATHNLDGSAVDIVTASGDITVWQFDGVSWTLISFIDISANNNNKDTSGEIVTIASPSLLVYGSTSIDSNSNAVDGTLGSGEHIGQIKTIVMIEASNSSTISITNHQTSDPEVATFDAVDETGVFLWSGTEWITLFATCTFV